MRKLLIASFLFSLLLFPLSCTYDKFDEVEECDNSLMASLADQTSSACGIASGSITAAVIGETAFRMTQSLPTWLLAPIR